jgi:hypothetical protein
MPAVTEVEDPDADFPVPQMFQHGSS